MLGSPGKKARRRHQAPPLSLRQLKSRCRTRAQRRRFNAAARGLGFRNVQRLPPGFARGVLRGGSNIQSADDPEQFIFSGNFNPDSSEEYEHEVIDSSSLDGEDDENSLRSVDVNNLSGSIDIDELQTVSAAAPQTTPAAPAAAPQTTPLVDSGVVIAPGPQTVPILSALTPLPIDARFAQAAFASLENVANGHYYPELGTVMYKPRTKNQLKTIVGTSATTSVEYNLPVGVQNNVVNHLAVMADALKAQINTEDTNRNAVCKAKQDVLIKSDNAFKPCDAAHATGLWKSCLLKQPGQNEKRGLIETYLKRNIPKANREERLALDIATKIWRRYVPGQLRCSTCSICGQSKAMNGPYCFACYNIKKDPINDYRVKRLAGSSGKKTMQWCPFCNTMQNRDSTTCHKCQMSLKLFHNNADKAEAEGKKAWTNVEATNPTDQLSDDAVDAVDAVARALGGTVTYV